MFDRLAWISGLLALVAFGANSALAQATSPTDAELTLRPGDMITWAPNAPHRVRFGGTVNHSGANLVLTPFADIQKVLDISPALTADAQGVATTPDPGGQKVSAKVKDDAASSGVTEFFFTCGFPFHTGIMVTVAFKVAPKDAAQPPRDVQIVSINPPAWILKTPTGDKKLVRP
jgi:hypothetical protein